MRGNEEERQTLLTSVLRQDKKPVGTKLKRETTSENTNLLRDVVESIQKDSKKSVGCSSGQSIPPDSAWAGVLNFDGPFNPHQACDTMNEEILLLLNGSSLALEQEF